MSGVTGGGIRVGSSRVAVGVCVGIRAVDVGVGAGGGVKVGATRVAAGVHVGVSTVGVDVGVLVPVGAAGESTAAVGTRAFVGDSAGVATHAVRRATHIKSAAGLRVMFGFISHLCSAG